MQYSDDVRPGNVLRPDEGRLFYGFCMQLLELACDDANYLSKVWRHHFSEKAIRSLRVGMVQAAWTGKPSDPVYDHRLEACSK